MFEFRITKVASVKNDLLSGLTVALALVPEAVAFAFVAGVEPLVGLYAAFMVGLITAVFGGRPGMISGATGALAVVMVTLVAQHGVEYLFAAVVLMGLIQICAGLLGLGKFIRMVPRPVMLGFVNGLAIVIFLAQLSQFGISGQPGWLSGTSFEGSVIDVAWMQGEALYIMLGLVALTMVIIHFLPRFTTAIPSSLAAIIIVSLLVIGFEIDTRVVGDVASISGGLPSFHIPSVPFTWETFMIILPYSVVLAAIGLIESMLTLRLVDEVTETLGRGNRENFAQGLANTVTGFFGGMGGCAMIGQSMINVNSGGRGRLSGITAALCLLMFILFASSLIEQIPLAALVGVMFIVVLGTFEWSSFRIIRKIPASDAFVLVLVSSVTVFTDLAFAVTVGVIVSALVFAWKHAKTVKIQRNDTIVGETHYLVNGPIFFSSTTEFEQAFTPKEDAEEVFIDFAQSRVCDHSGLRVIESLTERYEKAGKTLHLQNLSQDCQALINQAGDQINVNVLKNPRSLLFLNESA
ncbi:SulP family inorganic anion transporter [Pleionea sp. CnH1-48]|uniref:SulP family inorganic anion transporter n=1 Tax=Pleionea sp. CnH1-48 TaxID=2954494 RepID=UPI002096A42A|nr:SulP family inorganic anion transporter [Pleionea sp. CnH1-48]MCO7223107.1 SulP family inorganic anion transporter [Pleionea sp. CnH1-48]